VILRRKLGMNQGSQCDQGQRPDEGLSERSESGKSRHRFPLNIAAVPQLRQVVLRIALQPRSCFAIQASKFGLYRSTTLWVECSPAVKINAGGSGKTRKPLRLGKTPAAQSP
jgi:hypothetical protein